MAVRCYNCNTELGLREDEEISRYEECPECYTEIKCCMMCEFYDKNSRNECAEPAARPVEDKKKPNYCKLFRLGRGGKSNGSQDLLAQANSLFKK